MNLINRIKKIFIKNKNIDLVKDNKEEEKKLTSFQNKAKGSIYGLAIGDALGAPLEFQSLLEDEKIKGYVTGGIHKVISGEFTDDTSMSLALMDSLNVVGFNLKDQADRYTEWQKYGKYSSRGYCFDIGITTTLALNKYRITQNPISGGQESNNSGNGSLMRLAPVPLYFYKKGINEMISKSIESSLVTHQSDIVIDTLKYFVVIYEKILSGERDKSKLMKLTNEELIKYNINNKAVIELIHEDDFYSQDINNLRTSGFVVFSTIISLYALYHTKSFKEAVLLVVNQGGDADTNGAITGQLAGAYYGFDSIPKNLVNGLNPKNMVDLYAEPFVDGLEKK